ncbi:MAG: lysozyme [Muribaculaceae bacterium]|nr:lysozyme [Muribaculaceae bacterium]
MEKAIELIKEFEGLRLRAYKCVAGVWTIGWGHTGGVKAGTSISAGQAEELLRADVESVFRRLGLSRFGVNRRAALASFAFNVGVGAMLRSRLWRKVCANQADESIADEFRRWKYAGGKVQQGLIHRREKELSLYFQEDEQ